MSRGSRKSCVIAATSPSVGPIKLSMVYDAMKERKRRGWRI